jgi:PAS domain S-box-containing protein
MAVLAVSITIIGTILILYVSHLVNTQDRQRKQAEKQLKLAYILLRSSIEGHNDVLIFSIDKDYRYLNFNDAFKEATRLVYGTEVVAGGSMLESITSEDDRRRAKENCDLALNGEGHIKIEEYGEIERSFFETRYNPIITEEGEILGITVLSANVTERMLAEEKILTLNTELEAFSYSVAHDLRAPLRVIDGYSNILMEDYYDQLDEECKRLLKVISGNANKMGHLIDDLLSFSKLGRLSVNKNQVDMQRLINGILEDILPKSKGVNYEVRLKHLEPLHCDSALMHHVFTNLISNAVKYSQKKEQPIIEIDSYKEGRGVVYAVKDNGAGFDMKYVEKLFGVFQRLHSDSEFVGNGVGLATVKRIIKKHGGKVWAEGKVNEGATFYVYLP